MTPADIERAKRLLDKLRGQKRTFEALSSITSTTGFDNIYLDYGDPGRPMGEDAHRPHARSSFIYLCAQAGLDDQAVPARMIAAFRGVVAEEIAAAEAELTSLGVDIGAA